MPTVRSASLDQLREQRHAVEQARHIVEGDGGLLAVLGKNEHLAALADGKADMLTTCGNVGCEDARSKTPSEQKSGTSFVPM